MLNGIKGILFDLDGTLVDSMWIWKDIDVEFLGRYQQVMPEGLQESIEGMSFTETAAYFQERFRIPLSISEIQNVWNQMAREKYETEVPLKKGAADFLKACRQRGIRLGIASSNSRELVSLTARANGIYDYFDSIMTSCEAGAGKPSPDIYLKSAAALGLEPEVCLVFEDIPAGMIAGKRAGMKVCGIADVFSAHLEAEKRRLCDYYIKDYTEIIWR